MTALAGVTPSNEQAAAIRSIVEWYRNKRGPQEYYLAGYAGVGKSTVAGIAIQELRQKCGVKTVRTAAYTGKAASVLRSKGIRNAQTIHSLIYTAVVDEVTGDVNFILSPDSPAADADLIVLDECFSRETMVDTPDGPVYICDLNSGDKILNAWGVDEIVATMKKEAKDAVQVKFGGKTITCSANHRYFTARGLIAAADLRPGDTLIGVGEAMRLLRGGISAEKLVCAVLWNELQHALVAPISVISREDIHCGTQQKVWRREKGMACVGERKSRGADKQNSNFKSRQEPRNKKKNQRETQSEWLPPSDSWWKWTWPDRATTSFASHPWHGMEDGVCILSGSSSARLPNALQAGPSQPSNDDCHRNRWGIAPITGSKSERQEKGSKVSGIRVESVEVLELGDSRLDRLRDADGKLYLYDLQAARHSSFSVNGALVHNCSMVDSSLAADLRSYGKKIMVMGDPGQLPPVKGQGAFTDREPDFFLREIHRQAAESPIIEIATLARQGKQLPVGFDRDGVRVLKLTKETQPLIYREETQPICGLNRVRWVYTQRIRKLRGFESEMPQVGERVMCCRNDKDTGLFNGGMGTLEAVNITTVSRRNPVAVFEMDVDMDDLEGMSRELLVDPYLFRRHFNDGNISKTRLPKGFPWLKEYDWSYVITAHKSQGSQYEDVTVVDDSHVFRNFKNNHLYTAITRAEKRLTVLLRR